MTDAPASETPPTDTMEVPPAGENPASLPGEGTLISETEVNTYLAYFYTPDGKELLTLTITRGEPIREPDLIPKAPGLVFAYWYLVDKNLQGDETRPYDFSTRVEGLTYLMARFTAPADAATPDPLPETSEEPLPELTPDPLPETSEEPLPELTAEPQPEASEEPLPEETAEPQPEASEVPLPEETEEPLPEASEEPLPEETTEPLPETSEEPLPEETAEPQPPQALVRVYLNAPADSVLAIGDRVRLTAQAINCGESPRFQWQFSTDNSAWSDVPGATSATLDIVISHGNAAGYWRVGVTITD